MKLKTILLALTIFFVTGLIVKIKFDQIKIEKLKFDNDRINLNWQNSIQEANENRSYYLKEKDLSASLKAERDNLAEKLKVKPKQIEKIVHVKISVRDSSVKDIPVKPITKTAFEFTDTINKCSIYKGIVILTDDKPIVKRTGFFEQNKAVSTYYRKRPHKFIIRYGKFQNFVSTEAECGKAITEQFTFVR